MKITDVPYIIAKAADGHSVPAILSLWLCYMAFNHIESVIERLLFGKNFEHWLDVVFLLVYFVLVMATGRACARINHNKEKQLRDEPNNESE